MKTAPDASRAPAREWILLITLALMNFVHVMDFVIMMPLGPQFMRAFGIGPQEFGWMISAYSFSSSVFGFIGAFFIDRFDRKRMLLSLFAGFTVATLCCALAPTHGVFILARTLAGAFGGVMGATILAIIGDVIPASRRGAATGTVMSAFAVSSILGVPFGLYLATRFEWHAPFYFLAALGGVIWFGAAFVLPAMRGHIDASAAHAALSPSAERGTALGGMLEILAARDNQRAFLLMVALMFAGFTVIPFMSAYLVANVGVTEGQLPLVYLAGGSVTLLSSRFFGKLADRYGARPVFTRLALLSALPILAVTHLSALALPGVLAITTCFMVLMSGRMVVAFSLITGLVEPRRRGSFMSVNNSIQQMSAGLAALLAGLMIGKAADGTILHYNRLGLLAIACTLASVVLVRQLTESRASAARAPAPVPAPDLPV